MSDGLDVIIVDDDKGICDVISELVESFYSWGNVFAFADAGDTNCQLVTLSGQSTGNCHPNLDSVAALVSPEIIEKTDT